MVEIGRLTLIRRLGKFICDDLATVSDRDRDRDFKFSKQVDRSKS